MSRPAGQSAMERAQQVIARCRELARCTDVPGETTRTYLSPATRQVHTLLGGWMRAAGMDVRVDAAGNLRGLLPGAESGAPRLLIGSHLDTVTNAGAFDGILGVVLGVSLVEAFVADSNSAVESARPFAVEVIGFSEEEGVRFRKPFLGSLAAVGELDSAILALRDADGISVKEAIRRFGLAPEDLAAAAISESAFAYLEFHIEQGPVLESEARSLGVVDAIAGQTRMEFIFAGQANHAGTTPMGELRRDALAAAAQWIVEVERYANSCRGLVATVGRLESSAHAGNIIAGRCVASLDVRHPQDELRRAAVQHLIDYARTAALLRRVSVEYTLFADQSAVPMDPEVCTLLARSVAASTRNEPRFLTSGAGHDAMIIAKRVPSAMLFLRSPGGLSHHPDESVLPEDVAAAFSAGMEFLRSLRDDRTMLKRLVTNANTRKQKDLHA